MRTLVIAGDYPWPMDSGSRLRLAMVLRGLSRCGPTELFSVISKFRTDLGPADESLDLAKVGRFGFDNRPTSGAELLPTLARSWMPVGMPWRDADAVQDALARFVSGRYDLVWYFGARPWVLCGQRTIAPTIIDLVDLEDQKILARLSQPRPPVAGVVTQARRMAGSVVSHEEVRRWQRLHRRAASRATAIVVCSRLDAERASASGVPSVKVIPNGYEAVAHPAGREAVGSPPTIVFCGLLTYPPNIEAARTLARHIGPTLREVLPDVQIRLVGQHAHALDSLHEPPEVTVTGRVPDIATELSRADLVVVPLRYASGTRLKILEAFAHRIPVVSTSIGAEGLGACDGEHLLIADTVPALAEACGRLLTDLPLRRRITARAHDLFSDHFRTDAIEEQVGRLARSVAD